MNPRVQNHDSLCLRLKYFIVETFKLKHADPLQISDNEPIVGGSLGLDSLDMMELMINLEEEFGIRIEGHAESRAAAASIATLADYIHSSRPADDRPA